MRITHIYIYIVYIICSYSIGIKSLDTIKKGKAISVRGRGGLKGCGILKIPLLTDDSEVVSVTSWPRFISKNTPSTHFC
jgi:hypothetical protein